GDGRRLSGEYLEQRHPQAVDIALNRRILLANRLGSDISPRPLHNLDLAGKHLADAALPLHGQRKINQFEFRRLRKQDVIRLEIVMQPTLLVHSSEGQTELFDKS